MNHPNMLKREMRHKAATKIQCLARSRIAYKRTLKQRKLVAARLKQQLDEDELELEIDKMHEGFMKDLLVIRTQKAARSMIAKKAVSRKFDEIRYLKQKQNKEQINKAASRLQSLVRGFITRRKMAKMLPALKKEMKNRVFCIECVTQVAVKRCRQCRDRFCIECFAKLHRKGFRKLHNFELIREPGAEFSPAAKGSRYHADAADVAVVEKKINPKDWQEFYDATARAKYWFNTVTNEASWTNPFLQGK